MAKVYKSVCCEADILLHRIVHLCEKEIKFKLEMEKLMNKGFVNIAKARYIMGSTCVTKMQLPSEKSNPIQPVATVCRAELNNHWVFHIHRKDIPKADKNKKNKKKPSGDSLQETNKSDDTSFGSDKTNFSEEDFIDALSNHPKALKKSKYAFHVDDDAYQDYNEELLDEFSNRGSDENLHTLVDPMRLFGVLVPYALKQGQETFKDVVGLLGKCATIQSELRESLSRYSHLKKVKALMEIAASEAKINILETKVYWTLSDESLHPSHLSAEGEKAPEEPEQLSVTKSIRSVFYDDNDDSHFNGSKVLLFTQDAVQDLEETN
ncbi:hypothetical protein RUM43_010955 [Polyplax serrata]|uniref:Vacuolar ATPase assembly protein VMA22 n=1 Tax=Polyplax serrata TaxID=468196 RepID=A0AAN8NXP7_POLSC